MDRWLQYFLQLLYSIGNLFAPSSVVYSTIKWATIPFLTCLFYSIFSSLSFYPQLLWSTFSPLCPIWQWPWTARLPVWVWGSHHLPFSHCCCHIIWPFSQSLQEKSILDKFMMWKEDTVHRNPGHSRQQHPSGFLLQAVCSSESSPSELCSNNSAIFHKIQIQVVSFWSYCYSLSDCIAVTIYSVAT